MARGGSATNKRNTRKTSSATRPHHVKAGGVKINTKSSGLSKKQKAVNKAQSTVHKGSRENQNDSILKQRMKNNIGRMKNKRKTRRK